MAFMLDNGFLGLLFDQVVLPARSPPSWGAASMNMLHLSETVRREFTRDQTAFHAELKASFLGMAFQESPIITVHPVPLNDRTLAPLLRIRSAKGPTAGKDLGEDESIVMLMTQLPDLQWVTLDKGAAVKAIDILGGARVCSPFEACVQLAEAGMLTVRQLDQCVSRIELKHVSGGLPLRLQARYDALAR
jgi:hypothetical protein